MRRCPVHAIYLRLQPQDRGYYVDSGPDKASIRARKAARKLMNRSGAWLGSYRTCTLVSILTFLAGGETLFVIDFPRLR